MTATEDVTGNHFIRQMIAAERQPGDSLVTRFPPEPNGFLHIGHAKSICLNFGLAQDLDGTCRLRFDDTNPAKESDEYVEAIKDDIRWLGFDWEGEARFASDYFEQLYDWARYLIEQGLAYVDSCSADEMRALRGTLTEPGKPSPYRDRPIDENLDLFSRMRQGEFADGAHALRAKIDMASPNINMRDPVLYRIRHLHHHRTGDDWCIYPTYDFAHGQGDAIEHVTHSLCTLEFADHRPLYDWLIDHLPTPSTPHQTEFSRLNLEYAITSKRKLSQLVAEGIVNGWDDPRMPTISGLRRRGYTAAAIREFCKRIGVSKAENLVDMAMLEAAIRDDLNPKARRALAVVQPIKAVIENWPEGHTETLSAQRHPGDESFGSRSLTMSRELWIEADDFMIDAPRKFFRLKPGGEVRLRYGYIVKCEDYTTDADGNVTELRLSYDPATRSGSDQEQRKVKGTIHWLDASTAVPTEFRVYDRLFKVPQPGDESGDFMDDLNPDSLTILGGYVEPEVANLEPETRLQFERLGYFVTDRFDHQPAQPVFNRVVPLRDSWARLRKQQGK